MAGEQERKRYRWTPGMLDVPFLFGAVGATELAGPSLITLLVGMGRGRSAAANLLTRMVELRSLTVTKRGRVNVYEIDATSRDRYAEVEGTLGGMPAWSGTFDALLYNVPETQRTLRDRVLLNARAAGYGLLRPGVLIAASDRTGRLPWDAAEFAGEAWLRHATLTPDSIEDARWMAGQAWELTDLGQRYEAGIARMASAPERVEPSWESLVLWRDVYSDLLDAQLRDPHLPADLLPRRWPADRFAAAQREFNQRFGTVIQPFLREAIAATDAAENNRFYVNPWLAAT